MSFLRLAPLGLLLGVLSFPSLGAADKPAEHCVYDSQVPSLVPAGMAASVTSPRGCEVMCKDSVYCKYYSWNPQEKVCMMFNVTMVSNGNFVSGDLTCTPEKRPADACNCGIPIPNEQDGEDGTFIQPWKAVVVNKGQDDGDCSGTLISDRWVLTAAHCYPRDMPPSIIEVLIGDSEAPETTNRILRKKISKMVHHPDFDESSWQYDLLLLQLTEPINFKTNEYIRPICLHDSNDNPVYGGGDLFLSADWKTDNNIYQIYSQDKCKEEEEITDTQLCALGPNTCKAKNGAGLIENTLLRSSDDATSTYLVGVYSWATGCPADLIPGVYTTIESSLDWLKKTVGETDACPSL